MTLSEDIGKIFKLDEAENRILSIMVQGKPNMTPYLVWKETRRLRKEIPQRTLYGKFRRLCGAGYVVKVREEEFKRTRVKGFYDLTLKGMLAALADEKARLEGASIERFRKALHIPQEYEKAVRAIISIWARGQSEVPVSDLGKIDADSIRKFIYKMVGSWKALELGERSITTVERAKKSLGITGEEYETLTGYFITLTAFVSGRMDFEKRVLPFGGSSILPTPWFSDCVQISPIFGVRLFWSPSKCEGRAEASNFLSWLLVHKNIADVIARGDEDRLNQYMKEMSSKLQFSWAPYCLKLEHDGECAIKDAPCPHTSILECATVRENSKEIEQFLNSLIKEIPRALQS
jgi:hypothetical protein